MKDNIIRIPKEILEKEENVVTNFDDLKEIEPIDWDEMVVKEGTSEYKKSNEVDNENENEEKEKTNEKSR